MHLLKLCCSADGSDISGWGQSKPPLPTLAVLLVSDVKVASSELSLKRAGTSRETEETRDDTTRAFLSRS